MWDSQVYVRKLYGQELGFRGGRPGGAGRYFFISKDFAGYFPPLSDAVLNDYSIIKIIPPHSSKIVMVSFKYHNSKVVHSQLNGRDEYRMYLNSDLDPNRDYFKIDDIIMLHKFYTSEDCVYKAYCFSASVNADECRTLENLLDKYGGSRGRNHALIPKNEIPFLRTEDPIDFETKIIPERVQEDALRTPIQSDVMEDAREEVTRLIRSASFRDLVLFFYQSKCAITNSVINYNSLYNLEAAHIIPRAHRGQNSPKNGMALCRDFHWAFDKGFFAINDDFIVDVHPEAQHNQVLTNVQNKKIFLPQDKRAWPSLDALKWHRENIYGSFLNF